MSLSRYQETLVVWAEYRLSRWVSQALKALQEAWKRIDDLEQKVAAARAEGHTVRGSADRQLRETIAQSDRLQVFDILEVFHTEQHFSSASSAARPQIICCMFQ